MFNEFRLMEDISQTGENTFTWKFKYKERPKSQNDLGLISRYDRGGYFPKKVCQKYNSRHEAFIV